MHDYFLSFDGKYNRKKIKLLKESLTSSGIDVFYDDDYSHELTGENVDIVLSRHIDSSEFFIFIIHFNRDNKRTFWVERELEFARGVKRDNGFIIPVIIGENDDEKIKAFLNDNGIPRITGFKKCDELNDDEIKKLTDFLVKKKLYVLKRRNENADAFDSTKYNEKNEKKRINDPLQINELINYPTIQLEELSQYILSVHQYPSTFNDFEVKLELKAKK